MTIISALPFDLQNGTTADATQVMANFDEILNDVNNNGAHNGVNNDITALSALTTPITPAQGGSVAWYAGASTGTANAQVVASPTPANFAFTLGFRITFIAGFTNTGAATLNVNGTGVKNVLKNSPAGPIALSGGEIVVGDSIECLVDGTQYILLTNALSNGGFGPLTSLVSAATTDLGTIPSHNVNITGTTTVTSFGSTAIATYPVYNLTFSGALILTYNATSLILPGSANITTATGDSVLALYLGSGNWIILNYNKRNGQAVVQPPVSPNVSFNALSGLTGSTAGGSGTMGMAAGVANDSTNAVLMVLASAYTKTTASWAVGSGNGGLDTGAIAINTWYHFFAIERVDTGVVDILFSLSATAPTLPTNYTLFRRIFSAKTDGSSHWLLFTQVGDYFIWAASVSDGGTFGTSRTSQTLTGVPTGVVVNAQFQAAIPNAGGQNGILFTALFQNDVAATNSGSPGDLGQAVNAQVATGDFARFTNTSAQIGVRSSAAAVAVTINTTGWIDTRGK